MKFSFIIPVLNSKKYLVPCLEWIFYAAERCDHQVEVIVIDNGSSDGSWEILQAMEAEGKLVAKKLTDVTVSAVRNYGAGCSTGDALCFYDSDCLMLWDYFEKAAMVLAHWDATGCKVDLPANANWIEKAWYEIHATFKDGPVNYINSGNFLIKREVFQRIGGFDATLTTCEDVEICYRLKEMGFTLYESHTVRAVHLGGDRNLGVFFRKNVWRGLGMMQLKGVRRIALISEAHVGCLVAAIASLFLTLPVLPRIILFVLLFNLAPAAMVAYRSSKIWNIYSVFRLGLLFRAMFLYHLYFLARFLSVWKTTVGRSQVVPSAGN